MTGPLIPAGWAVQALGFVGKHWSWFAMAGLALTIGVQHLVIRHEHDAQYDRRACIAGRPCTPRKWQAEAQADEATIAERDRQHQADLVSVSRLEAAVSVQSAAAQAQHDAGAAALAQAEAQIQAERRASAGLKARLDRIAAPIAAKPGEDRCRVFDDTFLGTLP